MPGSRGGVVGNIFKLVVGFGIAVGAVWLHGVIQTNLSVFQFMFVVLGLVAVGGLVVEIVRKL